jgi:hypothetical protein
MINEYIKKGEKEFHDKMDMGDVYLEKGKHKEAVNQYMNSLRSLGSLWIIYNSQLKDASYDKRKEWELVISIALITILFKILKGYMNYKPDHRKLLFLLWALKKSLSSLGSLESYFDADILEFYEQQQEKLEQYLQVTSSGRNVESLLEGISKLASTKETVVEIDEGDGWFEIIREDLYRICALEICPIDIPKPQSSNFWERRKDKLLENLNLTALGSYLGIGIFGFYIGWSWVGWFFIALAALSIVIWSS